MLSPRSELNADDHTRERLFPWWSMLLFGVTVAAVLLLFFPQRWLLSQVEQTRPGDRVSEQYLEALVKSQPGNVELRLALARQYMAGHNWSAAGVVLQPLLRADNLSIRTAAQLANFDLLAGQMFAAEPGSEPRRQALQRLWQAGRGIALTSARWLVLADEADRQQNSAISGFAIDKLIEANPADALRWLERAAKTALARGQYQEAAERYFSAMQRVRTLPLQRRYFLLGLRTLQSGNLLPQAVAAARRYGAPLADDRDTQLFLIRLCQAAGNLDEAERYARKLLQMSLLREWLFAMRPAGIGGWLPVADDGSGGPRAAFDEETYRLGYEVFVGNRKLQDAQRVAERAVAHLPGDLVWRKRLAQVAEWNQQPQLALQHWLYLARQGGSKEAWDAVLRLAPGLHDDEALLLGWQHKAETGQLDEQEWQQLVALYERNGEPLAGAAYLLQRHRVRPQQLLLQLAGDLQQRAGDDENALQTYRQQAREYGLTPDLALKIAALQYSHNRLPDAYATLKQAQPQAQQASSAYWRTLGQLAWQLEQRGTVISAYRQLLQMQNHTEQDMERLIEASVTEEPETAALLAERSWREFGQSRHLLLALDLRIRQQQWPMALKLIDSLNEAQTRDLQQQAAFWSYSAQIRQQNGQPEQALQAAHRALALDNADIGYRLALLWLLVDNRRHDELRQRLQQWLPEAQANPAYREAYAAGYLTMGEARQALPWFAALLRGKRDDPLWLMNYADALEQALQPDLAWRVRRHVWQRLQHQPPTAPATALLQQARLALQFAPADRSAALMRELLRQDRAMPGGDAIGSQAAELALAWALSTEQNNAAKAWLAKRYADNQHKPRWAELSLALQQRDPQALQQLLDQHLAELPVNDAIEAARLLQRPEQAITLAAERLNRFDQDDTTHAQLVETVLQQASQTSLLMENRQIGALDRQQRGMETSLQVAPQLRLSLSLSQIRQGPRASGPFPDLTALDPALPDLNTRLPQLERQARLQLLSEDELGQTRIELGWRDAAASFTSLAFSRELKLDRMLSLTLGIGRNLQADYSERLLAFGVRDSLQLGLRLTPSRLDYASIDWRQERLLTQRRSQLGGARLLYWEIGHKFRTEYPDWTLRLSGYHNRFRPLPPTLAGLADEVPELELSDDQSRLLIPEDSRSIGLNLGFGQQYADDYTRAARLFGDAGISRSRGAGTGYNWLLGIAGSVAGNDHLSAWLGRNWGGSQNALDSRSIGLKYKLLY